MAKGVRDVIRRAAKGSSWSHFMDYASPALFEVMPLRALLAQGKEFVSNGSDARRYANVRETIASSLHARGLEVDLGPQGDAGKASRPCASPNHCGAKPATEFSKSTSRRSSPAATPSSTYGRIRSRRPKESTLRWGPKAFYVQWQPEFLAGLRDLYAGFYLDDEPRFESGLHHWGSKTPETPC